MNLKRFIAILTALALMTLLVSCGGAKTDDSPVTDTSSSGQNTEQNVDQNAEQNVSENVPNGEADTEVPHLAASFIFVEPDGSAIANRNVTYEYDFGYYSDYTTDVGGRITIDALACEENNLLHLEDGQGGELAKSYILFIQKKDISEPSVEMSRYGSIVIALPSFDYEPVLTLTYGNSYLNCTAVK